MPKLTLLDMTQNIMSALGSDEINSITDTVESQQVAQIIKNKFFDIISRDDLGEHMKLFQLTASGDNALPVLMYRPDHVNKIEWIKYYNDDDDADTSDGFEYVTILPLQQFMDMVDAYDTNADNVDTYTFDVGADSWTMKMQNDKTPQFCTVVNKGLW
jgi:hypothetical protein